MTNSTPTTAPLSPEREAEIRDRVAAGLPGHNATRNVLAELDRVRAERDELKKRVLTQGDLAFEPLPLRWEGTVIHPAVPSEDDTIICCTKMDDGLPAALFVDDEHREALGLQLVDPNGDGDGLVAVPSEWDCSHGTADDEPFCQELDEDEHPECPTIRVHRDDAERFAAMVDMVDELRSRLVVVESLVERARDKGNTQIDTDALVDALGLDEGGVR